MGAWLKIENPGVAPAEAFTLLGASTKRGSNNSSTIGKFGTGNKHGVAVLLRSNLSPVVFAGNLKMEFGTRAQAVNDGLRTTNFNRVVVKYGGKDASGTNRSSTEDLGFVLEHGSSDWLGVDLALREFVSNSIDRSMEEGEAQFMNEWLSAQTPEYLENLQDNESARADAKRALEGYRQSAKPWENVLIEVVNDNQVRAKSGSTRIFVPLNNEVLNFFNNLGKWFLHFSEPELLGKTILPKNERNLGDRKTAVIYRRGVRVREFESADTPSLFDYNLENLKLDESRRVDDWYVQYEAAAALAAADTNSIALMWQSLIEVSPMWEHGFQSYGLGVMTDGQKVVWNEAFDRAFGSDGVICTAASAELVRRRGFHPIVASEAYVKEAERRGIRGASTVLTADDRNGIEVLDSVPQETIDAVDYAWRIVEGNTNGRSKPSVKTFRKIMIAGGQTLGFYRDGVVYINDDIATGRSKQLTVTALEEVVHHVTGATDNSRDFQDYLLNMLVTVSGWN